MRSINISFHQGIAFIVYRKQKILKFLWMKVVIVSCFIKVKIELNQGCNSIKLYIHNKFIILFIYFHCKQKSLINNSNIIFLLNQGFVGSMYWILFKISLFSQSMFKGTKYNIDSISKLNRVNLIKVLLNQNSPTPLPLLTVLIYNSGGACLRSGNTLI